MGVEEPLLLAIQTLETEPNMQNHTKLLPIPVHCVLGCSNIESILVVDEVYWIILLDFEDCR